MNKIALCICLLLFASFARAESPATQQAAILVQARVVRGVEAKPALAPENWITETVQSQQAALKLPVSPSVEALTDWMPLSLTESNTVYRTALSDITATINREGKTLHFELSMSYGEANGIGQLLLEGSPGKQVVQQVGNNNYLAVRVLAIPADQRPTAMTQPDLTETQAVRVDGLDFQLVGPVVWGTPVDEMGTPIPLALKITNRSDKDIQFNADRNLKIVVKNVTGEELKLVYVVDLVFIPPFKHPPITIAKGQSVTLDHAAQFSQDSNKIGSFRLSGPFGTSGFWQISDLKVGKYTIAMTYENADAGTKDAPCWVGKATTKDLTVEITPPVAVKK